MQIAEESSLELDARTGDDNEVKGAAFQFSCYDIKCKNGNFSAI